MEDNLNIDEIQEYIFDVYLPGLIFLKILSIFPLFIVNFDTV